MAVIDVPVLDFSTERTALIDRIRAQCRINGFFQITGHGVDVRVQENALAWSKRFFELPEREKMKCSKDNNTWNRGYELMRSQILEVGTQPDLKEGFYIGDEIPTTHPYFVNKKLNSGPNQWPEALGDDLTAFQAANLAYYRATFRLAADVLKAIALSLNLEENFFAPFMDGAVATMRLLHYPVQEPDDDEKLIRGIGAHTDFGAITLLLQDDVDGLQVWDQNNQLWIDVEPTKGAYVVNLGNLMQRWTNEVYKSNIHRVINKSGKERYSIPFFTSGNPEYVVTCIPSCVAPGEKNKFPPITVEEAVSSAYAESYARAQKFNQA
ncbi:Oxoglutarate/iron-dependent oxygenase [Niveomyces insectorum RCEF 264]|uniref:Oxoglutarate/iron-dependent oxygenase n=1 Tax=Niveomyces insectorum RCEF 264 TaxID=1081102 RepID=A0A167T719_9HYPO|nr:Oxoglutarate/iron-dependent oxygenase [Niveomyces insectorum RCEF 264]